MTLAIPLCPSPRPAPRALSTPAPVPEPAGPVRPLRVVGSTTPAGFVARGLLAALDSYLADALAAHRFVWELSARIEQLADLGVEPRTLTRLRWLTRAVALHTGPDGPSPADTGSGSLAATLIELRTVLTASQADR